MQIKWHSFTSAFEFTNRRADKLCAVPYVRLWLCTFARPNAACRLSCWLSFKTSLAESYQSDLSTTEGGRVGESHPAGELKCRNSCRQDRAVQTHGMTLAIQPFLLHKRETCKRPRITEKTQFFQLFIKLALFIYNTLLKIFHCFLQFGLTTQSKQNRPRTSGAPLAKAGEAGFVLMPVTCSGDLYKAPVVLRKYLFPVDVARLPSAPNSTLGNGPETPSWTFKGRLKGMKSSSLSALLQFVDRTFRSVKANSA